MEKPRAVQSTMSSSLISTIDLAPLNVPMRRPFITALGEKSVSQNLLVTVRLEDGSTGYGEASSSLAWPSETPSAMTAALLRAKKEFIGRPISPIERLITRAWEISADHPTAAGALECALLDAWTRHRRIPLWRWLAAKSGKPEADRASSVRTCLTVSAWKSSEAVRFAREAYGRGFRHLKIKVTGRDPEEDLHRVIAVYRALPKTDILIDGNQGFSVREAVNLCISLRRERVPIRLFEQPVHRSNLEGLAEVQRKTGIPVAADESARSVIEAKQLIRKKTVAVVNVKLAKSGLLGALEIIRAAKKGATDLMIGCMAESALGLSPSVHLACGTNSFRFVDLDSAFLVRSPVCSSGFTVKGPVLTVLSDAAGAGSFLNRQPK